MKTLDKKSIDVASLIIDGNVIGRVKPLSSLKKLSVRPRKSFTRVKSLRPLKQAGGKGNDELSNSLID